MHDLSFDLYLVTDFFMHGFMQIEHGFIACDPMWHGEEWENPEASRKPRINIDANECLAGLVGEFLESIGETMYWNFF